MKAERHSGARRHPPGNYQSAKHMKPPCEESKCFVTFILGDLLPLGGILIWRQGEIEDPNLKFCRRSQLELELILGGLTRCKLLNA